jgi:hypothetical protein
MAVPRANRTWSTAHNSIPCATETAGARESSKRTLTNRLDDRCGGHGLRGTSSSGRLGVKPELPDCFVTV